jgi:N-acetylmuramoyl-L-alanine amidase
MSPAFVKAVAWQESGWNQQVVSSANAIGVMQVLPSTGRFVSSYLVGRTLDLNDPVDNVEAGVAFLRYLYRYTGGDVRMTLAGYYQGLRSVNQNGMYSDTVRYIDNVTALRARY